MMNEIIFSAYQTFTEFNQTGMAALFQYPAQLSLVEVIFVPLFLFTMFVIALLTTYFSQVRSKAPADFIASFAAAGYFTVIVALVMSLIDGLINSTTLVVTIAIAVVGTFLLLLSRR